MNAEQFEEVFARLAEFAQDVPFIVKIVEAPHYRRYLLEHRQEGRDRHLAGGGADGHTPTFGEHPGGLPAHMTRDIRKGPIGLAARGVNAGNGHMFVSHLGEICPSGFLPLVCGNVRADSLSWVYRKHPVFRQLRDPDLLKGRCGICEYRKVCAGSRARAFAMTGDYLGEEPFCAYEPKVKGKRSVH